MRNDEKRAQAECIKWAWNERPETRRLLFTVENEAFGGKLEAAQKKASGMVPGVSDLILLIRRGGYGALCIELKLPGGKQAESQKIWQAAVEKEGYLYKIARVTPGEIGGFMGIIDNYLSLQK